MHQFQPLSGRELQNVIEQQWVQLELDTRTHEPPSDTAVVNAIARITGGNFRLSTASWRKSNASWLSTN